MTINDKLYMALKRRAFESGETVSTLVEDAIKHQVLEDAEDLEDAQKRYGDPRYEFADLVREFKAEGLL